MCKKCMLFKGLLLLVLGVLFLLRDLNVWNFWNIQWWTVAFLLMGLTLFVVNKCPKCVELN